MRSQALEKAKLVNVSLRYLMGRPCAGMRKFPQTFGHIVALCHIITLTSDVYLYVHWGLSLERHQSATDIDPEVVRVGPLFSPPSTSARVQSRFEFVEIGGDICSNYHTRHWDYRLVPGWNQLESRTIYESTSSTYVRLCMVCAGTKGASVEYQVRMNI